MSLTESLPRWDMQVVFPSLQSSEFNSAVENIEKGLDSLEELFEARGIYKGGTGGIEVFDEVLNAYNKLAEQIRPVNAYIHAFTSTDSRDETASAKNSEVDLYLARLRKLSKKYAAWVGGLDLDRLLEVSLVAQTHEYAVTKAKIVSEHQMSPEEESLASDMEITGLSAWSKLYDNTTSQLTVSIEFDGTTQDMPMSLLRSLAYDPDRSRRKNAFEAELAAWKKVEVPLSAAMNSIKGETLTLCNRRGWESPLDETLFNTNIDRQTLDAMMTAARESFPDFRRYMRAKAKALGISKMAFYDLFAPIGESQARWSYSKACEFVAEQFRSYSDKLGDFAERNYKENWIDAEPRPGKVDGAYCMGLRRDESRILMNYKPSFGAVSTLAHELGHGYHNYCLHGRTATQRALPMTLAETASIFCETIIRQAVVKTGTAAEKFVVLEASLQGSCQVVVDISSRFLFESSMFEGRKKRELSAREMCEHMRNAQLNTYGDGLAPDGLHPYMWAAKGHYYGRSFYNFPYMFGLLFGLGLYSVYQQDPEPFKARYDDLLSSTGMADAATLGRRFGIDITTPEFWRSSLHQIRADVDEFERLVDEGAAHPI